MVEIILIIQQLIASGTHIFAKSLTSTVEPAVVLFFRSLIASFVFTLWMLFNSSKIIKIEKKDYFTLFLLSLINVPVNQFLFLMSIKLTTAPNVALAYSLTPVFIFIAAFFFLNESGSPKKIIGTLLAVGGAVVLISGHRFDFTSDGFLGDILALTASISWAAYTIINKRFSRKYGAIYATSLQMIGGMLLYIPVFFFYPVTYSIIDITTFNWFQLLYLGIMASALAYAMWNWALTKSDASKISVFNNLQVIFTAILSVIFLDFSISEQFIIGGILILTGVFITQKSG